MAESDWDINVDGGSGADVLEHHAYQHSLISPPLPGPSGNDWARRLENIDGSSTGRVLFLYDRAGEQPVLADDVSISAAMAIAPRSTVGVHGIGVGVRCSSMTEGAVVAPDMFASDGYQLTIVPTGAAVYTLKLSSVVNETVTELWSDTRAGAVDTYEWFHLRLVLLLQPNGDILLQVFENVLDSNDVDSPDWVKIAQVAVDYADAYTGAAGVGFGAQCKAGTDYDSYIDWIIIEKGP